MTKHVYFFERGATAEVPEGYTVSKRPELPSGDFTIDEYMWDDVTLWFVQADEFTADERQAAYLHFISR